jgi:hypothetical protein
MVDGLRLMVYGLWLLWFMVDGLRLMVDGW